MAAKLHQIIAASAGVSTETERLLNLAAQGLGVVGEQSPLSGISRTYKPRDENGDELPPKRQDVQIRVESEVMPMIAEAVTKLLDLNYTRDEGNARARADVVVRGQVLLPSVPATQLLSLENALGRLRGILNALPVLDPAESWGWDVNRNVYATDEVKVASSKPVPQVQVLYDAVVKDGVGIPAQVRAYETTKPVGDWTEIKFSGAMPAQRKEQILRRLAELQTAVKYAREEANRIDVGQKHCGATIFDFLYTDALPSQASTDSSSS
jgi:hypothetical protein